MTPAQVISIMLAPIPWTRHMALLTKYIIFGTHFPNISGFAAAICGPAEAELSSGVECVSIVTATIAVMQI